MICRLSRWLQKNVSELCVKKEGFNSLPRVKSGPWQSNLGGTGCQSPGTPAHLQK